MALQKPSPWPFVGIGGMACLFFLYAATFTFWPWWVTVLLMVVWVVLMLVSLRWFTERPTRTPLLPLGGLGLYVVVLVADVFLV